MNVAIALVVLVVLSVATLPLAASHNRPFDSVTRRADRRWWVRQFRR